MNERDRGYLVDVLESSRLVLAHVEGKTKEDFLEDVQNQDAVMRRLELIGEAAGRISEQTQAALPSVPWNDLVGMRNFLIHQYGDIDLNIVWDTLQLDIPPLIGTLEKYLSSEGE